MRKRILKMLKNHEPDAFAENAMRPFWSLASSLPAAVEPTRTPTTIVDLAHWMRGRGRIVRT